MDKIKLTNLGEYLVVNHGAVVSEDSNLANRNNLGKHEYCNGLFYLKTISESHYAMFCSGCGLRITFPKSVSTFSALRKYLAQ